MNCEDIRQALPLMTLPLAGDAPAEWQVMQEHVAQCPVCQAALQQESIGDQEISRQMVAVAVPEGLADRLQERLRVTAVQRPAADLLRGKRRWAFGAVVAAIIMILFASPWLLQTFSPSRISSDELLALIRKAPDSAAWPAASRRVFPLGWASLKRLTTGTPRERPDRQLTICAADFSYRPLRGGEAVSGVLWMAPAVEIRDAANCPSLEIAQIEPNYGMLIWRENSVVYVLTLNGRALEELQKSLIRSRALV